MPKLLLADDSVTIHRVIELTFSGQDMEVVAVGGGEEAIARIPAERPDIVLADIGMPGRSGYDVAAFVKGRPELAHIPVLLLAGAFEPVDDARAEQVKCDGVLVKPFEPQQVIARVHDLIADAKKGASRAQADGRGGLDPESRIPDPVPGVRADATDDQAASDASDALDDYFDRLDAAVAGLGSGTGGTYVPEPPLLDDLAEHLHVPTLDALLSGAPMPSVTGEVLPPSGRVAPPPVERPDSGRTLAPGPGVAAESPQDESSSGSNKNLLAEVFGALLAIEQGEPGAALRLTAAETAPAITDELVDEVTSRVLERLAPAAVEHVVARIVSEVAERLVRDEIARIRGRIQP